MIDTTHLRLSANISCLVSSRYTPFELFLPMPSLSITSSAHWICLSVAATARNRRVPDEASASDVREAPPSAAVEVMVPVDVVTGRVGRPD